MGSEAPWPEDSMWWSAVTSALRLVDVPILQHKYASLLQEEVAP